MNRMTKTALIILAGLAVLLLPVLQPWANPPEPEVTPPFAGEVIARIDGEPVFLSQAQARVDSLGGIHGEETSRKEWEELILNSIVDDKVVRDEAIRLGVGLPPGETAKATAQAASSLSSDPVAYLQGLSERDRARLQLRIWANLTASRLYEYLGRNVEITDEETRRYFKENRDEFADLDPEIAFLQAEDGIIETLIKQEQDAIFIEWLEGAHEKVSLEIVDKGWWRQIDTTPPAADEEGGAE